MLAYQSVLYKIRCHDINIALYFFMVEEEPPNHIPYYFTGAGYLNTEIYRSIYDEI